MARTISIGAQGFAGLREKGLFFIDKTAFLSEWWNAHDVVTLICRPRRFGKTLNLDMVNCFFSTQYAGRYDLFDGLEVWADRNLRMEQGAWPVISLSFAGIKPTSFEQMREEVAQTIMQACRTLWPEGPNSAPDQMVPALSAILEDKSDVAIKTALNIMCEVLYRQTGKKAIVLLDEYDTPLQEAWISGYWDAAITFLRGFFNSSFKTNPYLERALITGITRVAHESIFSDFNNPKVITSSSNEYATSFGFTQSEVDASLEEFGLVDRRKRVHDWYDGFSFGRATGIYNPWSITNFLDTAELAPYWANSSGNALVSSLVAQSDGDFKSDFETLLMGKSVDEYVSPTIAFPDLEYDPSTTWALLVASGYLQAQETGTPGEGRYRLAITNNETMIAFDAMVRRWFSRARTPYNGFVRSLLAGDLRGMNGYLNEVALQTFSFFDTGNGPSSTSPERFYHGFVLGLLVDLRERYLVQSNRESGFGRYDVLLTPKDVKRDDGIILEFKVIDPLSGESSFEDAIASARKQIREKRYAASLEACGVPADRIRSYALAFKGKQVMIA